MRSKVVVVSLISLLFMKAVRSQSDELLVQGQTGHLFLQHIVAAKENWYSIGRLYNLNAKELAPYNKLTMAQPLSIGQQLEIPLTAVNFSQTGVKAAGESLVPLYYIIQEKEWMYRISVNHNKVPIANLEKWNSINKDQIRAGMHIIVGYLKVKTALSALATRTGGAPVASATQRGKPDTAAKASTAQKSVTANKLPTGDGAKETDQKGETKPGEKPTSTTVPSAGAKPTGDVAPAQTTAKPLEKPANVNPANTNPAVVKSVVEKPISASGKSFNGGYFKTDFTDGGKSAEGQAGTFKSTSGWQDGKYYALMNNIPVGTIVMITVASSGKVVYAKILGQLPDMKESAGLTIRISNAAASELGEGDARFNVTLKY